MRERITLIDAARGMAAIIDRLSVVQVFVGAACLGVGLAVGQVIFEAVASRF